MSTELHFDALRRRYEGVIRPLIDWPKIKPVRTGLTLLKPQEELLMVWYEDGDWRDGLPKKFSSGRNLSLVRIPAVKFKGQLLALDGCHRLTQLDPALVLVDWFLITSMQRFYMNDLLGAWAQ